VYQPPFDSIVKNYGPVRMFICEDPDGNQVEFIALPSAETVKAFRADPGRIVATRSRSCTAAPTSFLSWTGSSISMPTRTSGSPSSRHWTPEPSLRDASGRCRLGPPR